MYEEKQIEDLIARYFGLAGAQVAPVVAEFERVDLPGGDWLFQQGDPGDALYFLVRGRLLVWQDGSIDAGNVRKLLGIVSPGETVGEIALLTGETRTAGIQASRDCLLLKIDNAAFSRLSLEYPSLALTMATRIAIRMHHRTTRRPESGLRIVNVCVVPLDPTERTRRFVEELRDGLTGHGATVHLDPDSLARVGAPVAGRGIADVADGVSQELASWLEDKEADSRFMLYECSRDATAWSAFAVRQADLVVLVGDAATEPGVREWEDRLAREQRDYTAKRALVLLHPDDGGPITGTKRWLEPRDVAYHFHVRDDERESLERVCRVLAGEATGLVLGAGAARGFAHIGIHRAMVEAGIPIDWIGGSSIGSIIGGAIAHGWSPDEVFANCRDAFVGHNPFRDYTLPVVSLLAGKKMMQQSERYLSTPIEDLPIPFFCISASLNSGAVNIHDAGPLHKAIQAAAALPVAMPPAVFKRRLAIDGALVNSLPVDLMRKLPVKRVIAVKVSSRREYDVDYDELPSSWTLARSRWLPFIGRRYRVPGLASILLKSIELGTIEKTDTLGAMADLLIHPPVRRFGMTDVKHFDEIVEAGYQDAVERLKEWEAIRLKPADVTVL